MGSMQQSEDVIAAFTDDLVDLRRAIHRDPEIGLELPNTQGLIVEALRHTDIELTTGATLGSVVGVLRGALPGPTVLLRADMDALPIHERSGEPFASRRPGAMHACGHDLHVAGLVGAARLLATRSETQRGNVVLMFQPGEESDDGASKMIAEGVLDASGSRPISAYAVHVIPNKVAPGCVSTRPGPIFASADALDITIRGVGGHAGSPADTQDPLPAAALLLAGLQSMVARTRPVHDPAILSIGQVVAGTARNVIPDEVRMHGTIRSFSREAREDLKARVAEMTRSIGTGFGMSASAEITPGYPSTINAPVEAEFVRRQVIGLLGEGRFEAMNGPLGASEDFSRVLANVPGCLMLFGVGDPDSPDSGRGLHSATARFDDRWLPDIAQLLAQLAKSRLETDSNEARL